MGNRGRLHGDARTLVRRYAGTKLWIICRLQFKDRRRTLMSPGSYTELFFLDEATALAAGHRPCFECRREDARRFAECFARGNALPPADRNGDRAKAGRMDALLHAARVTGRGEHRRQVTFKAPPADLPDGVFLWTPEGPALLHDGHTRLWSPGGYAEPRPIRPDGDGTVTVLNPRPTVSAMLAGYRPQINCDQP